VVHIGVGVEGLANTVGMVGKLVVEEAEHSVAVAVVELGRMLQRCGSWERH
jgi:hypothetical protein